MKLYSIIYSDGFRGASMSWPMTLDLIRRRRAKHDSYRRRGIFPVRVVDVTPSPQPSDNA